MASKIVLTGSKGNLGKHIAQYSTFKIIPVCRDNWATLLDEKPTNIKSLIHCAYDLKNSVSVSPADVMDSNLLSTMKALEFCAKLRIKKFIFISSCAVYGHSNTSSELQVCEPITINGLTKLLNEKIILEFCQKHAIQPLILRAFNAYGGDDQFSIISKLIRSWMFNTDFTLMNNGQGERDFIHVADIAKIINYFVEHESKYSIINLGTGKSHKIIEIVEAFQEIKGEVSIINQTNIDEVKHSKADITRLNDEIKFDFINVFDFIKLIQ